MNSPLILNEYPIIVYPQLAAKIGLKEAIVLQQIHYWLQKSSNVRFERPWVYNSIEEWKAQFPFWSADTIRRTIESLEKSGIVESGCFNLSAFDKTKWYTINYSAVPFMQIAQIGDGSLPKPIPETTTETTTETNPLPPASATPPCMFPAKAGKKKNTSRVRENTPQMVRIGSWFHREPTTLWSISEAAKLSDVSPSDAELDLMERFYKVAEGSEKLYRRHEVATLLNNWTGELDKARNYFKEFSTTPLSFESTRLTRDERITLLACRNQIAAQKPLIDSGRATEDDRNLYDKMVNRLHELEAKAAGKC